MLFLRISTGQALYALDAKDVIEIIPYIPLQCLPHAPKYVSGLISYRGDWIPVIDITCLMTGYRSHPRFSTRIILVHYPGHENPNHILGLLAEGVTDVMNIKEGDLKSPQIKIEDAPYLGGMMHGEAQSIQCIHVQELLNDSVRTILFPETEKETV